MVGAVLLCLSAAASGGDGPGSIHITLRTGEVVIGPLLNHTEDVVVLEHDGLPYAIAYRQMTGDSAYPTRHAILVAERGGRKHLTAADLHGLGVLALEHDRVAAARRDFAAAAAIDGSYRSRGATALDDHRRRRNSTSGVPFDLVSPSAAESTMPKTAKDRSADPRRAKIVAGYKEVGRRIADELGGGVELLETTHFLIWTDWIESEHELLRRWCEQMYTALRAQFRTPADANVFAGKCPVFCLKSRKRFKAAARLLDDYDAAAALGYASSDANGHVHLVLSRQGGSYAGRLAFANTLVHEGTLLFLHRMSGPHRLPAGLSEGLADHTAEEVLGELSPNGETARATAQEIVRGDYNVRPIFADESSLDAVYYPVAQSLTSFLDRRGSDALLLLVRDIKTGVAPERALEHRFGWTIDELERAWREAQRAALNEDVRVEKQPH